MEIVSMRRELELRLDDVCERQACMHLIKQSRSTIQGWASHTSSPFRLNGTPSSSRIRNPSFLRTTLILPLCGPAVLSSSARSSHSWGTVQQKNNCLVIERQKSRKTIVHCFYLSALPQCTRGLLLSFIAHGPVLLMCLYDDFYNLGWPTGSFYGNLY